MISTGISAVKAVSAGGGGGTDISSQIRVLSKKIAELVERMKGAAGMPEEQRKVMQQQLTDMYNQLAELQQKQAEAEKSKTETQSVNSTNENKKPENHTSQYFIDVKV